MSPLEVVFTTKAPKPLPQFSQAIKYNGMVYCSGNIGINPQTSKLVEGGVTPQTRQVLSNLAAVLEEAGSAFANAVKCNIFLTDMRDFAGMNAAWDEVFSGPVKPCRTCVAVSQLPIPGAVVEIEVTAYLNSESKL